MERIIHINPLYIYFWCGKKVFRGRQLRVCKGQHGTSQHKFFVVKKSIKQINKIGLGCSTGTVKALQGIGLKIKRRK